MASFQINFNIKKDEIVRKRFKREIEKLTEDFHFRKESQKYRNDCIQCGIIKQEEYQLKNHDKIVARKRI